MTEITLSHKFEPRRYQLPFLRAWDNENKRRFVLVWHRRSGKDKTCIGVLPKKMFEKVAAYYYFAPTYSQGKKIFWDGMDRDGMRFIEHFPKEIIKKMNDSEQKIELVNGSFVQVIGTDNTDRIVGTNPYGCIFTEFSLQQRKAWDLIRPILAENGGWAVFVFTPRGMNHAWEILQTAQANPDKWFWEILTVDDTGVLPKDVIEEEKSQMPKDLFEQEYYCRFIEGAGQFFKGVDDCTKVLNSQGEWVEWTGNLTPNPRAKYTMGADWAKFNDFTVLTPFDLTTFRVGRQDRFNQIDYNLQKAKAEAMYLRYNKSKLTMDSTGVGEPIYDDLTQRMQNIVPYHFTEASRKDLLTNLQILIEQRKITIPNDPVLISELKSFRYELTDTGKVRIAVPENQHDDCVMSLALAVWDIPSNPIPLSNSLSQEERKLMKEFDAHRGKAPTAFIQKRFQI